MTSTSPYHSVVAAPLLVACLFLASAGGARADALADQGKQLYTQGGNGIVACIACHGAQGEGMPATNTPYLAGNGAAYLDEQLVALRDGRRKNPIMEPIAKALSADQRQAIIAYVQTLPPALDDAALAAAANTQPDPADAGAWIANRGDWANQIPACTQCHAAGGTGVAPHFPAIAGLSKPYIIEQFTQWRQGKRFGGPQDLMGDLAKRMSDAQIEAVATYFSELPQAAQGATQ